MEIGFSLTYLSLRVYDIIKAKKNIQSFVVSIQHPLPPTVIYYSRPSSSPAVMKCWTQSFTPISTLMYNKLTSIFPAVDVFIKFYELTIKVNHKTLQAFVTCKRFSQTVFLLSIIFCKKHEIKRKL